ncbi:MAG: hypothetical protein ACFWT2_11840 [Thermoanaerobacterium thermosaccharolyticum]
MALFQYIICFGYTCANSSLNALGDADFNTSYVSVIPKLERVYGELHSDFNTSYVSVILDTMIDAGKLVLNFNTSYVSVILRAKTAFSTGSYKFQYIICFGYTAKAEFYTNFYKVFQYIICFGYT